MGRDRQTETERDGQTDRQTETETDRDRETETQRQRQTESQNYPIVLNSLHTSLAESYVRGWEA